MFSEVKGKPKAVKILGGCRQTSLFEDVELDLHFRVLVGYSALRNGEILRVKIISKME